MEKSRLDFGSQNIDTRNGARILSFKTHLLRHILLKQRKHQDVFFSLFAQG